MDHAPCGAEVSGVQDSVSGASVQEVEQHRPWGTELGVGGSGVRGEGLRMWGSE